MTTTAYDEKLAVPWWAWPAALALSLLIAASLHLGADGARAVVPYVVVPALLLGATAASSRGRVTVADGVLHVPGARAPLTAFGELRVLDREGTRRVRGPVADPRAHVATRPWLPRSVQVRVVDPDDDTPYWLIGTRHPEELARAIREGALRTGGRAPGS